MKIIQLNNLVFKTEHGFHFGFIYSNAGLWAQYESMSILVKKSYDKNSGNIIFSKQ